MIGWQIPSTAGIHDRLPARIRLASRPGPAHAREGRLGDRAAARHANDWVLIRLAGAGVVKMIEVDRSYFLGNSPGAAKVTGICSGGTEVELLPRTGLLPDTRHRFLVDPAPAVDSVRLDIYPDGGLARLWVWGELT
jgi:allantoicase